MTWLLRNVQIGSWISVLCFVDKKTEFAKAVKKQSQYKNDATQLKNFLGLTLPPFFRHRVGDGKRRQFQNQKVFQLNRVFLILTAL